MEEWISVKDRLPKDGMIVAVYAPNAFLYDVWPARWDSRHNCFSAGGGWFELEEVTHWMHLSEPPKGYSHRT